MTILLLAPILGPLGGNQLIVAMAAELAPYVINGNGKTSPLVMTSFIDLSSAGNETRIRNSSRIYGSAKNDGLAAHSDTRTISGAMSWSLH